MLYMWEISSGQPPFINYDYELAMSIIDCIRPKIASGTPLEYKILMKQRWVADPLKRPDIHTLTEKIRNINTLCNQNKFQQENNNNLNRTSSYLKTNYTSSKVFSTSKIHKFENLLEPRNATEVGPALAYGKKFRA